MDYAALARLLMQGRSPLVPAGDVIPFRPRGTDISQQPPMPEPNNGYMPTQAELDMLKRILPQVIPFPGKK